MSIARPPAARLVADTSILREARWPRLLAHLDAHLLEVAIERSDRGLTHARRLEAPPPVALGACLKAFLAAAGQSAVGGALVIDGSVAAGRFLPRGQARSIGVETLRLELGLRTLRVIDEREALSLVTGAPANSEVRWALAPGPTILHAGVSTAVCRLGSDTHGALLAPVGQPVARLPLALMSHPFAPVGEDELIVVASMRARGLAPVFGNLLGTDGIARAFEALAGIDYDSACPLPAEGVVSLASRDARARRACAVICAAIAQLCALLSFEGVRRVLLAGPAATLLAPALADYPLARRLQAVRAEAAGPAAVMAIGVLAAPIRFLEGARTSLDDAMRALSLDATRTLVDRVGDRYAQLTPSNQRVADVLLDDPAFVTTESISTIAASAGVSPSQVSRFCRTLGFGGLIDFKLELVASLARADSTGVRS
ncbi:MAG: MurR/RpiR family transcriptional regulator [Caulobacter sp.]|nr:MurR/RpiR family transcriptional regulator [Vitreoscilla sp.]